MDSFHKILLTLVLFTTAANAEDIDAPCKGVHNEKSPVLWNIFIHGAIAQRLYSDFQKANFPVSSRQQKDETVYTRMSSNLLCAHYENPNTDSHDYVCGVGFDGGGNARRPHQIKEDGRKVFEGKCTLSTKNNSYVLMVSGDLAKFASDQTPIYFYKHIPDLDSAGKYVELKRATHLFTYIARKDSAWGDITDRRAAMHIQRKGLYFTDIGEN